MFSSATYAPHNVSPEQKLILEFVSRVQTQRDFMATLFLKTVRVETLGNWQLNSNLRPSPNAGKLRWVRLHLAYTIAVSALYRLYRL